MSRLHPHSRRAWEGDVATQGLRGGGLTNRPTGQAEPVFVISAPGFSKAGRQHPHRLHPMARGGSLEKEAKPCWGCTEEEGRTPEG